MKIITSTITEGLCRVLGSLFVRLSLPLFGSWIAVKSAEAQAQVTCHERICPSQLYKSVSPPDPSQNCAPSHRTPTSSIIWCQGFDESSSTPRRLRVEQGARSRPDGSDEAPKFTYSPGVSRLSKLDMSRFPEMVMSRTHKRRYNPPLVNIDSGNSCDWDQGFANYTQMNQVWHLIDGGRLTLPKKILRLVPAWMPVSWYARFCTFNWYMMCRMDQLNFIPSELQ